VLGASSEDNYAAGQGDTKSVCTEKQAMTVEQWGKIIAKIAYAENGCWIWTGAATTNGAKVRYPAVRINGKTQSVRRVLYEERYGAGTMTKRTTMSCGNMLCALRREDNGARDR